MTAQSLPANADAPGPPIAELIEVAGRARRGDFEALPRLRQLLDEHPEAIARYGDLARHAQLAWIGLAAGPTDLALGEMLRRRVGAMRAELSGPSPTALERLLVDRVVVTWLEVNYADSVVAAPGDPSPKQADFAQRRQERAHRRHLTAVAALASIRKRLARASVKGAPVAANEASAEAEDASHPAPSSAAPRAGEASPIIPFPGRTGRGRRGGRGPGPA